MKKAYIWLPLWIAIGIAIGILIGNLFSGLGSPSNIFSKKEGKLNTLLEYIDKAYVDTVNVGELIEGAIPSIVTELDPHSNYISAEDMELSGDDLEGHFSGIGVEFIIQNDTIAIVSVISGGPSEAVGILAGDRIIYANDSLLAGNKMTNTGVFKMLRGKKDTKVDLKIKRYGTNKLLDFQVTRADVPVKIVEAAFEIEDGIGYIKMSKFAATTFNEFINAIAKLKAQGCESFIIDLQGNTGGYLNSAILTVNEFLERGQLVVYTEGRAFPRENVFADGSGSCKSNQLVVLIDEGSASASEIFAGAMQDNDRGLIIGRRSFGKGLVQNRYMFNDGSAVQLTIARYYTPSGRCIQKQYERGKRDAYDQDYMNRYLAGEFDNKDSIKTDHLPLFHTTAGRPVYGNDGIIPDIFVPRDTIGQNSYYIKIVNSGIMRDYAFLYTEQNRDLLKKLGSWEQAVEYLDKQPLVDNLVSYADSKGVRRRPYLINESQALMKNLLQAFILRNVYGEQGFYPVFLRDDILTKKAVLAIKEGLASPEAIRKQAYKKEY